MTGVRRIIGNGSSVSILSDPRILRLPLNRTLTLLDCLAVQNVKAKDNIIKVGSGWDVAFIKKVFL